MNDIICPHCHKAFKVDEAGYASIVQQVRNTEFDEEIHKRLLLAEKDKMNAVALAKSEADKATEKAVADKEVEIQSLKATLDNAAVANKLAVQEVLSEIEKERDDLQNSLEREKQKKLLCC